MANKRKNTTIRQQLEWLEDYLNLKNNETPCKEQLLCTIRNDINRKKWSVLKDDELQCLESLINDETVARANRIFSKYLGEQLPVSFHDIGIWYMDQFLKLMHDFIEDEERCEEYGYVSDYGAFDEESSPACVFMHRYHDRHIVWVSDEIIEGEGSDYIPECDIFDTRKEADIYFESLANHGIKEGSEQIQECLKNVAKSEDVTIKPNLGLPTYDIDFRVYYKGNLLIEHMGALIPEVINQGIIQYEDYCKKNQVEITDIRKYRPWNSNQRYYVVEFYDRDSKYDSVYIHIPSKMQGRERAVVGLLQPKNIVKEMR